MYYKYEIINNGKEDILYLYLNMKYEFSKELIGNDFKDLSRRTKNFINSNKINFNGNKVYLIVDNIVVKTVDISTVEGNTMNYNLYSPDHYMVNIELVDSSISEITLREYLLTQLFTYYSFGLHNEVYKAICVLFNTYAYKMMSKNKLIPFNDSFSTFDIVDEYKTLSNYNVLVENFNLIIDEVCGQFLSYNNDFILPFIHYSNNGYTLANKMYPFLSSVKCLWDLSSNEYINYHDYNYNYLSKILNVEINSKSYINIKNINNDKIIIINDKNFSCSEFRNILNLKSNNFYIIVYEKYLRIITIGCGNYYGLSLFAANEIAKNGSRYNNILNYFFPKTKLCKYIKKEQ